MDKRLVPISKFLSRVLRHHPETIGLSLDAKGWADVEQLLAQARQHGLALTLELLREVVEENDKQRFVFNDDGTRIRASQGHSIPIDLGLAPAQPPHCSTTAQRHASSARSGCTVCVRVAASTCICPRTRPPPLASGAGTAARW